MSVSVCERARVPVPVSIRVCVIAKENWRVRFARIQGDRCLFCFVFFFLRVGGGISDHQRPTFHKFILSRKRNGHFCVIPCHITHCPLVITNAEREIERTEGEKVRGKNRFSS